MLNLMTEEQVSKLLHVSVASLRRLARKEKIPDAVLVDAIARAVFVYGFAKSERANIDVNEEKQFKEAAQHVSQLTEKQLAELVENGDFCGGKGKWARTIEVMQGPQFTR